MHLRKIAAVLLGLSMLLTGCSEEPAAKADSMEEASAGVQTEAQEQESTAEPVTDGVSDGGNIIYCIIKTDEVAKKFPQFCNDDFLIIAKGH